MELLSVNCIPHFGTLYGKTLSIVGEGKGLLSGYEIILAGTIYQYVKDVLCSQNYKFISNE